MNPLSPCLQRSEQELEWSLRLYAYDITPLITMEMEDAVRARREDIQRMLAISHHVWSSYSETASTELGLPPDCVQPQKLLDRVPAYLAHGICGDNESVPFTFH